MIFIDNRSCEVAGCQHTALWRESAHGRKRVCQEHREKGVAYSQLAAICAGKVTP